MKATIVSYSFSNFELDILGNKLLNRADNTELNVTNRQFVLLRILCEHSPRPVSKDELVATLWPNTHVSDWSLSRLISDTRKLLNDDGENQTLIRTERGVGFVLKGVVHNTNTKIVENTHSNFSFRLNKILVFVVLVLSFTFIAWNFAKQNDEQDLVNALQKLSEYQDNTYTAFVAQVNRRNELVEMVKTRLGVEKNQQYEKFFAQYFPQFNQQEQFVCEQMRAITSTGLMQNNQNIVDILNQTPAIFDEIQQAKALQQHLRFWLNKYHSVFKQREDMCLLYVGVEDNVPYPSGVDLAVKEWLSTNAKR